MLVVVTNVRKGHTDGKASCLESKQNGAQNSTSKCVIVLKTSY